MPASHASVSDNANPAPSQVPASVLVISTNWLGDAVMAMPALQSYRRRHPHVKIAMVTRPHLEKLWHMHAAVDEVYICSGTAPDQWRLARQLGAKKFAEACIWPRSFRSALLPWLLRIPRRYGLPGHWRDWLLTDVVPPPADTARAHQAFEYLNLMGDSTCQIDPPVLQPPPAAVAKWHALSAQYDAPAWLAIMPGAAFGPAKRWPARNFAAAARHLQEKLACGVAALGTLKERALCAEALAGLTGPQLNLAGETSLEELAAILATCRIVITNDSGGMHLAAAMQTPVVAIFGVSDPDKTGPLGTHTQILQKSPQRARDFKQYLAAAEAALAAITPNEVVDAVLQLLNKKYA